MAKSKKGGKKKGGAKKRGKSKDGKKKTAKKKSTKKKSTKKKSAQKKSTRKKGGSKKSGARTFPSAEEIVEAAERARSWLSERTDFYGYVSRRATDRGAPELASHLRGDLLAGQDRDGSWNESLVETTESLWQLLVLGLTKDSRSIRQALEWLYDRRDAPGAFAEGCSPARHEQQVCEHYLSGFFSPGPASKSQEVTLSSGQTVNSDTGARLLASERALRTALRADPRDPRAQPSVDGLRGLPVYLEYGGSFTPAVLVGAVQALGWTAGRPPGEVVAGLELLAENQEKDGTWPNVEFFFVLEALLEVRHSLSLRLLQKATPRLLETQHKYGGWGRNYVAAQTWIGMRALEAVAESLP